MYLKLLNNEQKELFLDLLLTIAFADNDFDDSEQITIKNYCDEMELPFDRIKPRYPLNQLLDKMATISTEEQKRIIVFEAMGLAMIDNNFVGQERKIIELMSVYFCVDSDFLPHCEDILNEYLAFQNKINTLLFSEQTTI